MSVRTNKRVFLVMIILCLLIISGCSKEMTDEEYKSFTNILNGKIETLMEVSINNTKEPFVLEEREKLHTSALKLKEEINKTIDENKNKIPKKYKKEFKENELKEYINKLVDYVMLENKGIQDEKMNTVNKILEITNCKFEKNRQV